MNVRDLGGMRTADGGLTRWGAVVRMDNPARLTPVGWSALHSHGVRTVVALRTIGADDDELDAEQVAPDIDVCRVEVEDRGAPGFVERCVDPGLWGTPLYFRVMLDHWPDRCATAVTTVAQAQPGGVALSCGRGCDRTGLVVFLLLALVGVPAEVIAADWLLSIDRLRPGDPTIDSVLEEVLEREQVTALGALEATLAEVDVARRLRDAGLADDDLAAIRTRLLAASV